MAENKNFEVIDNNDIDVLDKGEDENRLVLKLVVPATYEGKNYTVLDLRGLERLKGRDLIDASRYLSRSGDISFAKELEAEFCYSLAAKAVDLPIEFFYNLGIRDAVAVKNRVTGFLYSRD